jgi:predicted transcriptional regulator
VAGQEWMVRVWHSKGHRRAMGCDTPGRWMRSHWVADTGCGGCRYGTYVVVMAVDNGTYINGACIGKVTIAQ